MLLISIKHAFWTFEFDLSALFTLILFLVPLNQKLWIFQKQTSTKNIKQKSIFRTVDWNSSVYRLESRVGYVVTLLNKSHTTPDVQLLQLISIQPLTCFNSVTVSLLDEYSIVEIWRYCLQTCRSLVN